MSFDPGSGEGLAAAIAKAYERKEPFFGYYWAPTSILGKYPMVRVKGMTHDPATWKCLGQTGLYGSQTLHMPCPGRAHRRQGPPGH